jgi:phospholipid/cholesterol/gamma-HCH transport system substrate-binding protein
MDLEFNRQEKIVGMFMVCMAVLLFSTVVIIGRAGDWFKTYVTFYTTFNESYNLQENAAVKLFKADIGRVKRITLVENKVKVKLAILEEYAPRIKTDSVATVESPTFIGDEYVAIKPGSRDAPLIPEGGEIPSMAKKSISDILDEFEVEKTAKMVIKAVQNLSEVAQILRDPNGPLLTGLDNISRIIEDIQSGKGTAGSVLKSRELVENLLGKLDQTGNILENIDRASSKTPETMDRINDNIANIKTTLKELETCVGLLKETLMNVKKGSHDIPRVTQSARRGIKEIRKGVENIETVVKSVKKNFLIRRNLPPEPEGETLDSGLRQ